MSEIKKRPINPLALVLGLSAVLFGLFVVFSFVYFFVKGDSWKASDKDKMFASGGQGDYVAVIEVKGVIMNAKKTLKNLKDAEEDNDIKAVVLRLNSPGGSVAPSQEIYEAVKRFKKPLVVSMESVAASGAYYIAAGAKKVYANGGTLTGSIGVIMEFINLRKLYDWAKIERYSIKTGKFKDSGAEYRQLEPEERAYFQALVADSLEQFREAVAKGRKMTQAEVIAVSDGRVFSGQQAKKLKLVDEIGTFDDALAFIAKEAKIEGKPKLAYPVKKPKGFIDLLTGSGREDEDGGFEEDSQSFVDRLAVRLTDRLFGRAQVEVLPAGLYALWRGSM